MKGGLFISNRQISIKIEGSIVKNHSVPFKLLANVLDGIQHTVNCIGLEVAGKEAKGRGRIPTDIQQACELRRVSEKPGSYEVVAEIADSAQVPLFDIDLGKVTLDKYMNLITYLGGTADNLDIRDVFPDSIHRRRILRSVETYCPREGDEWGLIFEDKASQRRGVLSRGVRQSIRKALTPPDVELLTVTGELMRLHLDEHKISILYPPTQRILDCFYDVEIEDFIIGNLKGLIQVTGRVQLATGGHPEKIIDVSAINELDLSTVKLSRISAYDMMLELAEPIIIEPLYAEQEVILEWPALHIIASGITREDAICAFEEDFMWLWKEYVLGDINELSVDAWQFRNDIQSMVKE